MTAGKLIVGKLKRHQGPDLPCQNSSERNDRGANTLCVTLAQLRGQARLSKAEFYYGFVTDDQLNATQIMRTMEGTLAEIRRDTAKSWDFEGWKRDKSCPCNRGFRKSDVV
jgi:hypothetical protein